MKSVFIVVNVDWFFLSHRLPIALEAKRRGYRVTIIAANSGKRTEIEQYGLNYIEVPFARSGTNPLHEMRCIAMLSRLYQKHRPDVIHHVTLKASLLGSFAAKLIGQKYVVNAISGLGYSFTDNRKGVVPTVVKQMVVAAFKSRSFRFILQNPDDVELISGLKLVPRENIFLIKGSGVDLSVFYYSPVTNTSIVRFLFPARILADKGVMELIEAALILKKEYEGEAEFVLAGDCDLENPTGIGEEKLKLLIDGSYIRWIGYQKNMQTVYNQSSVVVLPSYREGLPKSLIEACATGRAIITTDVPGCRECVEENYNGLLVAAKNSKELAEACAYFIIHKNAINEFGANSRKKAEAEFGVERVVEKTLEIYTQMQQ